jgi:hypothetical protein
MIRGQNYDGNVPDDADSNIHEFAQLIAENVPDAARFPSFAATAG